MRAFARAERPARRWYADRALIVAFTLDTAIAAVDAVTKTVLIGVVVVGPLVAAARTTPRRTAAIGGYAFLLAVYEGVPHGIFGSSDHVARCAAIGLTASLSVWVAWLRDRREAAQRHIVLLAEAGALLSASLDDVATMRDVAELVTTDLYDWCAVDLLEPDGGLRPIALAHRDGRHDALEQLQESWERAAHGRPAVAEVIRSGRARVYRAPERLLPATPDARDRDALRALGMASAMVVPMVARGRVLGAITIVIADPRRVLDDTDLATAQELARRCAMALDNALLYRERSRVADTLQESLLPSRIPEVPGFEVAARFHAGEDIDVGGDFFDLFESDGDWGAVIGDVSGKGAGAAALTALARYTIRAAAGRNSEPSEVLHALNAAILREGLEERFCTAVFVRLEPHDDGAAVWLSSGGHPPPLVVRSDGRVEPVEAHGMLLGIAPDPPLVDRRVELRADDKLVLYTDGVTEARLDSGMLGIDGLMALLSGCGESDTVRTGERIYRAAAEAPSAARDDIAVLVLRAVGSPGERRGNEGLARSGTVGQRGALSLRLRAGAQAPSAARRALDTFEPVFDYHDKHVARLLVSEVVTNRVRHGGMEAADWIGFEVQLSPDALRVQVADHGPGFRPHPRVPPPEDASGQELFLVDRLADRWGASEDGRRVWFELDRRRHNGHSRGRAHPRAVRR